MAKTSANYEAVYIVNPAVGAEGIAALVEKFKALVKRTEP
jgi:small subunit ribosomal protein S6